MRTNQQIIDSLERKITTKMSATIVADLLKAGVTVEEMAKAIKVSRDFLHRVQKKQHSFTYTDLKRLAKLTGSTPQLLFFNSMRPIPAHLKELFDCVRNTLHISAGFGPQFRRKNKSRRVSTKAA